MALQNTFADIISEIDCGHIITFTDPYKHMIYQKNGKVIITSEKYPKQKIELKYDNPYSLGIVRKSIETFLKNASYSVSVAQN